MILSHRFGSEESLSRARYWLSRCGFEIAPFDPETHDVSRLTLNLDFSRVSAALALIDSIERSDPNGWPGFLTQPKTLHAHESHSTHAHEDHDPSHARTPIHWRKPEESTPGDPASRKVSEYMFSRWE